MPYIKQERRSLFDIHIKALAGNILFVNNAIHDEELGGNLNYCISKLINLLCNKESGGTLSYHRINEIVGALENSKLEFARQIIAPYEDKKIVENGNI